MFILGSWKNWVRFWIAVAVLSLVSQISFPSKLRVSLDSMLSGLLALAGFMFAARTFITFKLQEVVYGNPKYQELVANLQEDGATRQALFAPLRTLDTNLGNTTSICFVSLLLFLVVACIPEAKEITLDPSTKILAIREVFVHDHGVWLLLTSPGALLVVLSKVMADTAFVYFAFCLYRIIMATVSLNKNIHSIIDHWEAAYRKDNA